MNDPIESRLRSHLSTLDDVRVSDPESVANGVEGAARRLHRRRRAIPAVVSVALIGGAVIAVLSGRDATPQSVSSTTGSTAPATTDAPATTIVDGVVGAGGNGWHTISPDPRGATWDPSVVWTGTEAIVVGGLDPEQKPRGGAAAYDPANDSWRPLASPSSGGRSIHPLVAWTGTDMLVIGGDNPDGSLLVSAGEAYDPALDQWRSIASPPVGFVSGRSPSAWTGDELLVWPWDGGGSTMAITPIAYDPVSDSWRELAEPPVARRQSSASVWTGTEWLVWGGTTGTNEVADGAVYDPATDTWRAMSASPLSGRRIRGVWTGSELIVAAGSSGGDRITGNGELALSDGAAYDPATDSWRSIASGLAHPGFVPVWTGSQVVMFAKGRAVIYDVATDRWLPDCCDGDGFFGTPVWTGSSVLVVGAGSVDVGGAVFDPVAART